MLFSRIHRTQFLFNKSYFSMPIRLWGSFFNVYYIAMFKRMGLLDPKMIVYHLKSSTQVLAGSLAKKGHFATGFYNFKMFKIIKKQKIKSKSKNKSYIVLLNKLYGFFTNLKSLLKHRYGLGQYQTAKYSYYLARRLPSVIFLMKNKGYIKTKDTFFYGQYLRLRVCLFQSLSSTQTFNGVGYCIYINNCRTLYSFYNKVSKYIYSKPWKNIS